MDECTDEDHRCLLAPLWCPCEPQGPVILQAVPRGVEGVLRPVLRALDSDVVQVARGVGVVGDERGDVLCYPPEDRQDDILHHFRWREGVEAPVMHPCQAQPVLALQGAPSVRLQPESQVGDRVRHWYPVQWVFQVGTEAQLQARDPLRVGHGALARVELQCHHPTVRGHRLHVLGEMLQRVAQQVVDVGLNEAIHDPSWRAQAVPLRPEQGLQEERVQQGALRVAYRRPRSMWTGCVSPCAVTMRSLAHVWRKGRRSMTSSGTERWRRMRWRAPCGAVLKALRASKERT